MPTREQIIEEAERHEEEHEERTGQDDEQVAQAPPPVHAQTAEAEGDEGESEETPAPGPGAARAPANQAPPLAGAEAAPLFGKKSKSKTPVPTGPKFVAKNWTEKAIKYLCTAYGPTDVMEMIGSDDSSPADVKKAHDLMVAGNYWLKATNGIPAGHGMARRTRVALYRVIDSSAVDTAEAKRLFNIRFQHAAADSGGVSWTYENIKIVWKNLDPLPDADVTQNTTLTTFQAIAGTGAFGPSWEATKTVNTIQIGQSRAPGDMPHAIRHEVGHAVHADKLMAPINQWLKDEVNVWFNPGGAGGVETWLGNIADFPSKWTDSKGKKKPFSATEKTKVVSMVTSFIGGGSSWSPARTTVEEKQPADDKALWKSMPAKIQNACTQSKPSWYSNWRNFQKGKDGKKYFLNYWYARPFYFGTTADKIIAATGDDYTAMSEKEFFANCYAEYFVNPEGATDSKKWGGKLPGDVKTFFDQVVVHHEPYKNAKDRAKNT